MSIVLRRFTDDYCQKWDRFVAEASRNGTIFQQRNFLDYHPRDRFQDASLLFLDNGEVAGVLPAARVKGEDGERVVSHPGSSAGGIVFHKKSRLRDVLAMVELAIEQYREEGCRSLELRLAEPIFSFPTDSELTFLLWHRGFQLKSRELSSCVNLQEEESWRFYGRRNNNNDVNRATRSGLTVLREDTPDRVYPLIAHNLNDRYRKAPTHSYGELVELKRRYPGQIDFWSVAREEEAIAAIVTFAVNGRTVHNFYTAQDYRQSKLHAMPLLFYTAFDHFKKAGYQWFNFGISSRADWIKWGIHEFKEEMGGRATCREVWCLDDLSAYQPYTGQEGP